ncbi:MAG TPA: AAA family ATPase [Humibacter sp.]|nr:AAA family ATPase [Humibacter sp.]
MARLILLNGAPGTGKSTLARRYADDNPLALVLDIDTVRRMLGASLVDPEASGLAARRLALAMAREHLAAGHDVIVPQFLGRIEFVLELESLAASVAVPFLELTLIADPDAVIRRFAERSAEPTSDEQRDAWTLQERWGGLDALRGACARVETVAAARPAMCTIEVVDGAVDDAYAALRAVL